MKMLNHSFLYFIAYPFIQLFADQSSPFAFEIVKAMKSSPPLDHFVVQISGDFLCWKYKEVVCFYVSNLRQ